MNFDIKNGKIKSFEKNEIIYNEGDICSNVCLVISGSVKISTTSELYNEFIISSLNEGDTFGDNLIFSDSPYYLGSVFATKKSSILFMNKEQYLDYIKNNMLEFLKINTKKYQLLMQRNKILLQKSIREKILFYLISKSNQTNSNIIKITTKQDLANYLNIERPSLSRELILLKKEGIIDYDRHYIYIKKKPN